jgi:hypothetical protein
MWAESWQRIAHWLHEAAAPYARGRWLAVAFGAFLAGMAVVGVAQVRFAALTGGARVPDLALFSGPGALYERIAAYGAEGRAFYAWFFVADFLYPLAAGALCVLLALFLTRASHAARWEWLVLLPAGSTGADWAENSFLLVLVCAFPRRLDPLAAIAGVLTAVKFALIAATALALAGLTARWLVARRRGQA